MPTDRSVAAGIRAAVAVAAPALGAPALGEEHRGGLARGAHAPDDPAQQPAQRGKLGRPEALESFDQPDLGRHRRLLTATLKGFGAQPTLAEIVVESLTPRQRLARAAAVAGLGLAAALVALPIPLVHFVLVPGSLLLGGILGAMRLSQRQIYRSAEGPWPFCGTRQKLGLAGKPFRLPRRLHCLSCGRELDLDDGR